MLERLKSFFGALPVRRPADLLTVEDDTCVAAAALMLSVIEADGLHCETERARLREALREAYGLAGAALEEVVTAGEAAQREAVDLAFLTGALERTLDDAAKAEFVGILWEIVYADGEQHEVEDNTVWRIAELIGVGAHERTVQRRLAREKHGLPDAVWDD